MLTPIGLTVIEIDENIQKVIEYGRANGMTFLITDPLEWTLEPLCWWDSTIPPEGMRRANFILNSGISVDGFYKAHEVEIKPRRELKPWVVPEITVPDIPWEEVAKVAVAVASAAALAMAAMSVLLVMGMAMVLCSGDPAVIAKNGDQYLILYSWVEVKK